MTTTQTTTQTNSETQTVSETQAVSGTPAATTLDPAAMVAGYFECWNAPDEDARAAAIARTWTDEAISADPLARVSGQAGIAAMMAGVFESYPGHSFRQVGAVDHHNNAVRWGWAMLDGSGAQVLDGIDVAWVADDGRIEELAGFFGMAIAESGES